MKKWAQNQTGFTIVELLIVVVVIAILATITIVSYNGITNQANDSVVKAGISNAAKQLELIKAQVGRYPISNSEMPTGFMITKSAYDESANNVYYCNNLTDNTFALGFRSKTGKGFIISANGLQDGVTVSGAATCDVIGKTWVHNETTVAMQGYSIGGGGWVSNSEWKWIP